MTIDERRAAAKARVQAIGEALTLVSGDEATRVVAEAMCEAVREVCLIDIESYGQLTATVANPETTH